MIAIRHRMRRFRWPLLGAAAAALALGTTSALAGSGVGAIFNLGQTNSVNATSTLSGAVAGPQLKIANTSTASTAEALYGSSASASAPGIYGVNTGGGPGLQSYVKSNAVPPLKVNSTAQVANLNASLLGGHASSYYLPKTGTAANSSKLGGQLPSYYLPASAVRRIGPTTVTACNPAVQTCTSTTTLVTIGVLTFSGACIYNPNPMGEQDVSLYLTSSVAGSAFSSMGLGTTTGQSDMTAGTPAQLADATSGTFPLSEFLTVTGMALGADGHQTSFTLYMAQNVLGANDGRCVFGGSLVVK